MLGKDLTSIDNVSAVSLTRVSRLSADMYVLAFGGAGPAFDADDNDDEKLFNLFPSCLGYVR